MIQDRMPRLLPWHGNMHNLDLFISDIVGSIIAGDYESFVAILPANVEEHSGVRPGHFSFVNRTLLPSPKGACDISGACCVQNSNRTNIFDLTGP